MTLLAEAPPRLSTVLHVGCGPAAPGKLPADFFPGGAWRELRLDIDPAAAPDILASITDMRDVAAASVDAVYSAHNVEHLAAHEVPLALAEFRRVIAPGGFALITVPDLQQVAALVVADRLTDAAYVAPAGPIAPLDMLYGHGAQIAAGNGFMAHRTGFTARSLEAALVAARFDHVRVARDGAFALWATARVA
ncbi:methyltransferase domain-containing protein [Roseomonas sp. HF4]|uniref:class I SAM-dependent methyltransferase n=1 Tax=Roseomonas sp. HF4 TaxID=2562313 RepID=UPI0010C0124A|nr:methyltransferase domain-containing protein [Roseomonas sp. HF4]